MKKEFIISNENGLHARPATELVSIASKFKCDITISFGDISLDLKSIMNVLSLVLTKGSVITISTSGIDEVEAMEKISKNIRKSNLR